MIRRKKEPRLSVPIAVQGAFDWKLTDRRPGPDGIRPAKRHPVRVEPRTQFRELSHDALEALAKKDPEAFGPLNRALREVDEGDGWVQERDLKAAQQASPGKARDFERSYQSAVDSAVHSFDRGPEAALLALYVGGALALGTFNLGFALGWLFASPLCARLVQAFSNEA